MTVHVPVEVLARLGGDEFGWQVPALREELVTALIKSLPKDLRRNFVPAPDTARAVLAAIAPDGEPILQALQRELQRLHARTRPDRRLRPRQAATAPAGHVRGGVREARRWPAARIWRCCRRSSPRRSARRSPRRWQVNWNGRACAPGPTTSTSCRAPSRKPAAATRCGATRHWSTRAPPSMCGCSRPRPSRRPRWCWEPVGCCASSSRRR